MQLFDLTPEEWREIGISLGILSGAFLLAMPVLKFILEKVLVKLITKTETSLDNMLVKALRVPLYWLVIVLVLRSSLARLDFLLPQFDQNQASFFYIFYALLTLMTLWRLIDAGSRWYLQRSQAETSAGFDLRLVPLVRRGLLVLVGVVVGIAVLGHFDVDVSGLVTTLGIGSLAIALAAQATLADTISGFVLIADKPFKIGDRIEVLELDTWGEVIDIGMRSTRIKTIDNRLVVIPNSTIAKSMVVNQSAPDSELRMSTSVGVAYGSDLQTVRQVITEAINRLPGVVRHRPVNAFFMSFGDSALNFSVYWWVDLHQEEFVSIDTANCAIYAALNQTGIRMPNPQQDVHLNLNESQLAQFASLLK